MDSVSKNKKNRNFIIYSTLLVFLVLACLYFIYNLSSYYNFGELKIHYKNQGIVPIQVSDIHTWMTFDYLNVVFKLPTDYLKNKLSITDPRYPNIIINRYALLNDINPQQLLYTIQQLINQKINSAI